MKKPKILLLADKRDWAYDHSARSIKSELSDEFDIQIIYVAENPIDAAKSFDCDLLHVFWWGESWHHALKLPKNKVLKEISSFRWREEAQFGHLDPKSFVDRYLADAGTLIATSRKIQTLLTPFCSVLYTPNGIAPELLYPEGQREGPIKVGWAGNINDACKGIKDIIAPACQGDFELIVAAGNVTSRDEMRRFYNQIDVFCIASTAEGEPLTLIEALACGCFPVSVDVGVVPELILHRKNGLIVERSIAAFRAALTWCNSNLNWIRINKPQRAADLCASRSWKKTIPYWRTAYNQALSQSGKDPSR